MCKTIKWTRVRIFGMTHVCISNRIMIVYMHTSSSFHLYFHLVISTMNFNCHTCQFKPTLSKITMEFNHDTRNVVQTLTVCMANLCFRYGKLYNR